MGSSNELSDDLSPRLLLHSSTEEVCALLPVPMIELQDFGCSGMNTQRSSSESMFSPSDLDVNEVVHRLLSSSDHLQPQVTEVRLSPRASPARVTFSARTSVVRLPDTEVISPEFPSSPMPSPRHRTYSTGSYHYTSQRGEAEPGLIYMFIILYYISAGLGLLVLIPLLLIKVRNLPAWISNYKITTICN